MRLALASLNMSQAVFVLHLVVAAAMSVAGLWSIWVAVDLSHVVPIQKFVAFVAPLFYMARVGRS